MPLFLFFLLSTSTLIAIQPTPLTLKNALEQGIASRSSLRALHAEMHSIKQRGKRALTAWLPQHTLTAGIDHAGNSETKGTPSFLEISTKQLIASGASPRDTYNILEEEYKSIEAEYQRTLDTIRFDIETNFLRAWLITEQKKTIDSLAISSHTTFAQKKAEHAEKLLDQVAWETAQTDLIGSITEIKNYEHLVTQAYANLSYAMGIYEYKKYHLSWNPQPIQPLQPLNKLIKTACKTRKELKILDYKISAKEQEISKTLKGYLPSVSAFASLYFQDGHPNSPTAVKNGGLQISWNIGDGVSNYFEAESLRALKTELLERRKGIIKQIKNEVTNAYHNLIVAHQTLVNKGFSLKTAHTLFKKKQQEKQLGIITKVDYDHALHTLKKERFAWISARVNYEIEERTLAFTCGYGI